VRGCVGRSEGEGVREVKELMEYDGQSRRGVAVEGAGGMGGSEVSREEGSMGGLLWGG